MALVNELQNELGEIWVLDWICHPLPGAEDETEGETKGEMALTAMLWASPAAH